MEKTMPASSSAWRMAVMLWGRGFLKPFSKSLIVISLDWPWPPVALATSSVGLVLLSIDLLTEDFCS
ncbi:hypothetical protein [Mesorhizobium sp. WSM4315]|uniref:hypothetical protein n=1 Tax=Mesorhizobium sp. WSM4315 TaxID=2589882 RepID=UPI001AEE5310|nr:hypothetical protein [Mesorhizobium sp. WSM4315]